MKKTLVLVTVVVFVHCVAISALLLVQGCKSTKGIKSEPASTTPVMPPLSAPSVAAPRTEAAAHSVQVEETIEYIVKSGDYIGIIAKRHSISSAELIEINKIKDPNKIRVGQKLIIPKRAHLAAPPASKPKARKSEPASEPSLAKEMDIYVIQAGDSLSKIASRFNVKVSELREVNKLANDKIRVGQKLIMPGKKAEKTPEAAPTPAAQESSASQPKPAAATKPADAASPAAAGSGITHVVMPNEDLSTIAKLYVVSVEDIVTANQLETNRTVQVGQKIIIPQP